MSRLQRLRNKQKIISKEKEILEKELRLLEHERTILDMQLIFDENCVEIEKLENMDVSGMNLPDDNEFMQRYNELQKSNSELHREVYLLKQSLLQHSDQLTQMRTELEELQSLLDESVEPTEIAEVTPKLVDYQTGIVFEDSSELQTRLGKLTLKNGTVIRAHFRNGIIVSISGSTPYKSTVDIEEIEQYIAFSSLLDTSFYRMLHPFPTNSETTYQHSSYTPFLAGLKSTTRPVRLIALCHGLISNEKSFGIKVIRVNNTAQGVCSFLSIHMKKQYMKELLTPNTDQEAFIHKARVLASANMNLLFSLKLTTLTDETRGSNLTISDIDCKKYNDSYEACKYIKQAPFKEFKPVQPQFNKIFQSNPGLCFLFVGYIPEDGDGYQYINLFALEPTFLLDELITKYISSRCKELYLADYSCAVPRDGFYPTPLQKQTLGGRITKK